MLMLREPLVRGCESRMQKEHTRDTVQQYTGLPRPSSLKPKNSTVCALGYTALCYRRC